MEVEGDSGEAKRREREDALKKKFLRRDEVTEVAVENEAEKQTLEEAANRLVYVSLPRHRRGTV